jgi:hypothetical protein
VSKNRINDWRSLAARVSAETDSKKLTKLIQQLGMALDREDTLPDSRLHPNSKPKPFAVNCKTDLQILCRICNQPLRLTFDTVADEDGQAVHEFCYAKKITARTLWKKKLFPPLGFLLSSAA